MNNAYHLSVFRQCVFQASNTSGIEAEIDCSIDFTSVCSVYLAVDASKSHHINVEVCLRNYSSYSFS